MPDILQEVALRVLRAQPDVKSTDELAAWCYVVATRLLIDEGRTRPTAPLPDDVDFDDGTDIDVVVERRVELDRVWQAMAMLCPQDRTILLALLEPPEKGDDRRAIVRDAVRRHRARARLVAALERLAGVVGGAVLRARHWGSRGGTAIGLAVPAAAMVLVSVPDPPSTPAPSASRPSTTSPTTTAARMRSAAKAIPPVAPVVPPTTTAAPTTIVEPNDPHEAPDEPEPPQPPPRRSSQSSPPVLVVPDL